MAGRWVCACSDMEKVMEEDGVMQRRECCGHGERACGLGQGSRTRNERKEKSDVQVEWAKRWVWCAV